MDARKKLKKKKSQLRKKLDSRKALMLSTVIYVGLVPTPEMKDSIWELVSESRVRLLESDEGNMAHHIFAQFNWRLVEIQLLLHLMRNDWLKMEPVSSETAENYMDLNRVTSTVRQMMSARFRNTIPMTSATAEDPESCARGLQNELEMIVNMDNNPGQRTTPLPLQMVIDWYLALSAAILGVLELATYHTIDIAVRPPTKSVSDAFVKICLLHQFVNFRETSDFPKTFQKWNDDNHEQHAKEHRDFNYDEAYTFMQQRWDDELF